MTERPPSPQYALAPPSIRADGGAVAETARLMLASARIGGKEGLFEGSLTEAQAYQIARLAVGYGLDPFAQHIIVYQGRPYITKKGAFANACEHPQYDGVEYEPADQDTRARWRVEPSDFLVIARVWRKDRRLPFVGIGIVSPSGADVNQPVAKKHPQLMAVARATRRALLDAFSLPIPFARPEIDPTGLEMEEGGYPEGGIIEGRESFPDRPSLAQLAALHAAVGKLGWTGNDDPKYRSYLGDVMGVDSSTELTGGQIAAVIEGLKALVARREAKEKGDALLPISRAQREQLLDLLNGASEIEIHRAIRLVSPVAQNIAGLSRVQAGELIVNLSPPPEAGGE